MITFRFKPAKTVQAGACLLKANGGEMDTYLFIKILYLSDREALDRWGDPITGDSYASMKYGPVLSNVYDLTKGAAPSFREYWQQYISDRDPDTNTLSLIADPGSDMLSKAEVDIIRRVYEQFGGLSWKKMRDYSHTLAEYDESVGGSSRPIYPETVLRALGKPEEIIHEVENNHAEAEMLRMCFGAA
jgi:uncharacterized phage-associated protein